MEVVFHHDNRRSAQAMLVVLETQTPQLVKFITLLSIVAANGRTSNTLLIAVHTSVPKDSPNLVWHSLNTQKPISKAYCLCEEIYEN